MSRSRATPTLFRDFLFLSLLGFVAMVVWLLPHVNPPAQEDNTVPPGNVIITIVWPPDMDNDVDLWVMGPGEIRPIGYSNKGGTLFNLLRDDLGHRPDASGINYENAYSRGAPAGEYIVNVHCYRCPVTPVPVEVIVELNPDPARSRPTRVLAETRVELGPAQEKTAIRFELNDKGNVVEGSIHNVYKRLRSGGKWSGP